MNDASKEYATALFILASEKGEREEFSSDLKKMQKVFLDFPEYLEFLASPAIAFGERKRAATEVFASHVKEEILSFLLLLCEKGKSKLFFDAVKEYSALFEQSLHIKQGKITSAVPLSEKEKYQLKKKLEARLHGSVILDYAVDRSLLGGLQLEIDEVVLDGSLRNKLREIKDVISK